MEKKVKLLIISIITLMSCQHSNMKFELMDTKVLQDIPGASGLAYTDNYIIVVGDNSPFLYLLDHDTNPLSQLIIYSTEDYRKGEIIKSLKPDFEALEIIKGEEYQEVFIFGSGSRSPRRDLFVHVILSEEPIIKSYSLQPFYENIRSMDIMKGYELNIEAVAVHENRLLLFNRGKNLIFDFNFKSFQQYLVDEISFPIPSITELKLPQIGDLESGFSGATIIPGTQTILFTTSLEDTPNAYEDGEVLGSFICMIDLDRLDEKIKYVLIEDENQPMKEKVESIAVSKTISQNKLEILMVTDSDGGESLLIKGRLVIS